VPVIYVILGYDEVAPRGPERPESLDAVAEVDRQIGIIARAAASAPRPYHVVVLSDHGQSQGATFRQRFGRTLDELVRELMAGEPAVLAATTDAEGWGHVNTVLTQLAKGEGRGARLARRRLETSGEDAPGPVADARRAGEGEGARPAGDETPAEHGPGREVGEQDLVVAASGNLANVYFTRLPGRATWEAMAAPIPGW
jgi:hypothetical protein